VAIGARTLRFEGIDAPETDQMCVDLKGEAWTCGIAARDHLSSHIRGHTLSCISHGVDRYGRTLATCAIGTENLNAWMVHEGWALAYVHYSREYVSDENAARRDRKGLWAGAFIAPWDWRHRDRRIVILGQASVPITAQAKLLAPASAATAPSTDCIIKGNINRRGERIYHIPGQAAYAAINMEDPRKRWFCSEDDARAAGWRPARR
jgi:Staphylococcal nuclease homologue